MSKELEVWKRVRESAENADGDASVYEIGDCDIIEKKLKEYQEIKEIAKRYNWDDITSEIFNIKTDKKYRDLFNSAIVNIQEDYHKARAFEIIKVKKVQVATLLLSNTCVGYNFARGSLGEDLTQEEYDLLKEVLS